jgi:predicted Rossmann fold flavoprotein
MFVSLISMKNQSVIIIGAGGAGLIASWQAGIRGASVTVLERKNKPGIKLLISGGGKCNVTHDGPIGDLLQMFAVRQSRFLKHALHKFTNEEMTRLLEKSGVPTFTRENGRVFPSAGRASDVVDTLVTLAGQSGARFKFNERVKHIIVENGIVTGVNLENGVMSADRVIIATGGVSYPKTGTTGDGFEWARSAGHTIVRLTPALAPIPVAPTLPENWRGVALRNGLLSVVGRGKRLDSFAGDILFTHEGISGPAALEVSQTAARHSREGSVDLEFDFLPGEDDVALDLRFRGILQSDRSKQISTIMNGFLPNRMVDTLLDTIGVPPATRGHVLTAEQRKRIINLLKRWRIGRVGDVNIERGEVTAGGVSLDEVNPKTMESRLVRGLYFAGEVLDIDGPVGGYNLQAAFSTGFVAGESAGEPG